MSLPILFYVKAGHSCGLRAAKTMAKARRDAMRELGTHLFGGIRYATAQDVGYIKAMGGACPSRYRIATTRAKAKADKGEQP